MLLHSGDGLAFGQGKSEQYRKPGTELTAALNAPSTDVKRQVCFVNKRIKFFKSKRTQF